MTQIYHNPRCSKSRQTLALLQENGVEPEVVLYLKDTPSAEVLKELTKKLGCSISDIIRSGEPIYRELGIADKPLDETGLINIVVENPILLERPIVVSGNKAAVGRPPENVLAIL